MKKVSILKNNLMRAVMTLALIVTCATAWAQNPKLGRLHLYNRPRCKQMDYAE